ncbi:MAG: imelysin family protein [Bacteroidia bacterium]|nr:imelysin family protein [Bacteroidia bacterium]
MMKYWCIWLLILGLVIGCKKDDSQQNQSTGFDRKAFLQYYADSLILPSYQNLQQSIHQLAGQIDDFTANPTLTKLQTTQQAWESATLALQAVYSFNFGPAGENGTQKTYIQEVGTFPANLSQIEAFIASGDTSHANFNRDTRGLFGMEALLFDSNSNQNSIMTAFQNSPVRCAYLRSAARKLKTQTDAVLSGWNSYRNQFINNSGTDIGSSTVALYNDFLLSYESFKNYKIGLPAGKRAGQTQPEPTKVEGYYSGKSIALFKAHVNHIDKVWAGKSYTGRDGIGFREYLESATGGAQLANTADQQWSKIRSIVNQFPEQNRLSQLIISQNPLVDSLFIELSRHTRFWKSDMSSILGLTITYSSGDGD